jgi:large subunit ribosomal protein L23
MKNQVLVKPIISEKSERLSGKLGQYSFVVQKTANKLMIKDAVESMYGVTVRRVNTAVMPSKAKVRNTRSGMLKGRVSAYKKAIVTLNEGEELDFFID